MTLELTHLTLDIIIVGTACFCSILYRLWTIKDSGLKWQEHITLFLLMSSGVRLLLMINSFHFSKIKLFEGKLEQLSHIYLPYILQKLISHRYLWKVMFSDLDLLFLVLPQMKQLGIIKIWFKYRLINENLI